MVDWFESLAYNHLPLTAVGSNPAMDFGEAIQLAYGTLVVLLRCPLVPEIMQGGATEVFLHK